MLSKDNHMPAALTRAYAAADRADWQTAARELLTIADPGAVIPQILALSLRALAEGDFKDADPLAQTLIKAGDAAVPSLLLLVRDNTATPEARWFGARILEECPPAPVISGLACYLEEIAASQDPEMTELVVRTLVQFGPVAIERLTTLLAQPPHRMSALIALSRIRHSQAIPALLSVVDDADLELRAMAIEALSSFHDQRVPPILVKNLTAAVAKIRCLAAQGLGLRPELESELGLVEKLTPLLTDAESTVAIAAAAALGRLHTAAAGTALFEQYRNSHCSPVLQSQIIQSLGWLHQPVVIDYLQKILSSLSVDSPEVILAIRAIAQQQDHPALVTPVLQAYLQQLPANSSIRLKQELAIACGNLGGTSLVNSLVQLLADDEAPVRWQASYCLQQGGEPIRLHLVKILQESALSEQCQAAIRDFLALGS
jgi:HEAT repeat protein